MRRLASILVAALAFTATLLLPSSLLAQSPGRLGGTVTKRGGGNPSRGIVKFKGPEDTRKILEGVFVRCDWFAVVGGADADKATVQVKGEWQNVPTCVYNLDVEVQGRAPFRVTGNGPTAADAAGKAVDGVLRQLFKVPALCNCPIVYTLHAQQNVKELFSYTLASGQSERLTHNNAISTEASWGHAGALVYTLIKSNGIYVILMDVKRQRQRIISNSKGLNSSAALSRDGRYAAIPLSLGKQVDLYLIDLAQPKEPPCRLTSDRDVESSPVFSPDGKRLCYVSDKSGRPQLYIIPLEGGKAAGKAARLQLGGGECVSPDWSFNNMLCFAQRVSSGHYVISVLDMNTQDAQPMVVTDAAGSWEAPTWAPDGRHIACSRQSGGKQDLYLVDSVNHTFRQLTSGPRVSLPAWAPAR